MSAGDLPHLRSLAERSARFLLDHGAATRTGLAWEHAATGMSPSAAGRASSVDFNAQTYEVWHSGTSQTPFPAHLKARTVVFDPPYFDLEKAPNVRGVVNWGAHDPGISRGSRPEGLQDEVLERFGEYPARESMYDVVWPSVSLTRTMSDTLVKATHARAKAAQWLLEERCTDWDFGFIVAGEIHSAIENLWHGIDPDHALHDAPSARAASEGLRAVYRATDELVGRLVRAFPDATVVAFAMNGMGPNGSDVASMLLLPELLHRKHYQKPLLRTPPAWSRASSGTPMLKGDIPWSQVIKTQIRQLPEPLDSARRFAAWALPEVIKQYLRPNPPKPFHDASGVLKLPFDWMPSSVYQPHWHEMPWFALPSFYDGRIRLNLAEREKSGKVELKDYDSVCDELEQLLRDCRDLRTDSTVVKEVIRCSDGDPRDLGPTECDLIIVWSQPSLGLIHPQLGQIGPVPYRRTGGHTGPYGMAYLAGDGIQAGDLGVRESYDVVPTLIKLLGEPVPSGLSGRSLL
jgi:predicted AlkP superfamily phosphohydrolase/phosphomutase